jgi:hypothetical protein
MVYVFFAWLSWSTQQMLSHGGELRKTNNVRWGGRLLDAVTRRWFDKLVQISIAGWWARGPVPATADGFAPSKRQVLSRQRGRHCRCQLAVMSFCFSVCPLCPVSSCLFSFAVVLKVWCCVIWFLLPLLLLLLCVLFCFCRIAFTTSQTESPSATTIIRRSAGRRAHLRPLPFYLGLHGKLFSQFFKFSKLSPRLWMMQIASAAYTICDCSLDFIRPFGVKKHKIHPTLTDRHVECVCVCVSYVALCLMLLCPCCFVLVFFCCSFCCYFCAPLFFSFPLVVWVSLVVLCILLVICVAGFL